MRTETITKTYKLFTELNDEQKQKAIEENRDFNLEHEWWQPCYDCFTSIASIMGIDIENIFFSGFYSQGDGACFIGDFSYKKGFLQKIKDYVPHDLELIEIAKKLQLAHRKSFYRASGAIMHNSRYMYAESINLQLDDEYNLENSYDDFYHVFVDLGNYIYEKLEAEHNYLQSDECISQDLINNEVEFEV